ncbi:LytR/AlgR family response regulator transcription factor [Anaerostipes sp.]|uniref:LytR/AlgR family response regulator transcription factor n=1 Tax=Anaerostipes sp. TaxID=1872530 RepID=UPI0025C01541|nr:LytTR family DNA-binding domain-containing protein [Anaerostipes sp.]MBS7009861.1 response regulator transcription factor [Anaerostipes sp.]
MRLILCDDDAVCLKKYTWMLRSIKDAYNLDFHLEVCSSGEQLLFLSEDLLSSDIILLDIMMPGIDGITAAKKLRQNGIDSKIIFLTSLSDKMLDAFDVFAYHYIIKDSVSKEKFEEIIVKAVGQSEKEAGEQLLFTYRSKNCMIPLKDISYLEVQNHKVFVHYKQEHFEIYDTLSNMETRFSKHGFIRIHKSFMVSLNQISKLTTSSCLLRSGIILPVGRSYSKQAKEAFKIWSVEAL